MYYFVKGEGCDHEGYSGSFEWVIKGESKEVVISEVKAEFETVEILELREISVEERIEREEIELLEDVKREYLMRNYGDLSVREYCAFEKRMQTDKEMYYDALVENGKVLRFKRRLLRYIDKKTMTLDRFDKALTALCNAKTEEEFNSILAKAREGN